MRKLTSFVFRRRALPTSVSREDDTANGSSSRDSEEVAAGCFESAATAIADEDSKGGVVNSPRPAGSAQGDSGDGAEGFGTGDVGHDNNGMRAEDEMCAICLDAYEDGEKLTELPCRHAFHTHCIRPWISRESGLCPMCKSEAFSRGGLFVVMAPWLETDFAELTARRTGNLAVLSMCFLASVACGLVAAKLSLR